MAGPSDQDKLSNDWGLEDIEPAPDLANMVDDLSEEERAAAAAAEWAAMLEGADGDGEWGIALRSAELDADDPSRPISSPDQKATPIARWRIGSRQPKQR